MKALSWVISSPARRPPFFEFLVGTPYLSTRSLRIKAPPPKLLPWISFFLYIGLTLIIVSLVKNFLSPIGYFDRIILGLGIYFFTEAMGAFGQSIFLWKDEEIFSIHHHPISSASLSEFWGRRWNLWVQDWIADMGKPFRVNPKRKILASFLFSGVFHEAMVNFPHWLLTGESYFGTMLAYFLIQGAGLSFDKKFLRAANPVIRRAYWWIIVLLPAPLFIHVPVLRFFGMTE